jgi:alanyl-tRNA synthetase
MKSSEIREKFLRYFEKNGHARVRSSPLVPANDPTLFFTNAGMVQFKDVFLGLERRDYTRATTSQKCMRVSGKHNDLENVGRTPRHHTFFEMLGNFSFGDYFKEEAIEYAWDFLTKEIGLSDDRMWITVFRDDDDAENLWLKHVSKERIIRRGEKDNFWAMGDTGPCGPCSEIAWDFGKGPVKEEDLDSDRFMEIWNLVFMQFNRDETGKMVPLARPSIDTGMGLERLAAVVQGKKSNWETDLFEPLIAKIESVTKRKRGVSADDDIALRVIADHIRGTCFLIADGVVPSNEGRGYVLRRIMRRAIRYGKKLGQDRPFFSKIAHVVVDEMGGSYPELVSHQRFIEKVISSEEERFYQTLDKGLEILQACFVELKKKGEKILPGDVAFKLYDTYGFPKDLTEIISGEQGLTIDNEGFEHLMDEQREKARASWRGTGEEKVAGIYRDLLEQGIRTEFLGYEQEGADGKVTAILKGSDRVKKAKEGEKVGIISDRTPFYGESGGQVGDTGLAVADGVEIEIQDTKRPLPEIIVHHGIVKKGSVSEGDRLTFAIDSERRQDIRCNHTATHLLHKCLRAVLGEHVKQSGSLVEPQRLRFDFSHFEAMKDDEIREVEDRVNEAIRKNLPVIVQELSYDEAVSRGALAFFGEKYGEKVRLVETENFSMELCGGTHVKATGEIGMMKIISESSAAAGIRRIEAVTGAGTQRYVENLEFEREELAKTLKVQPAELLDKVKRLTEHVAKLERDLKQAKNRVSSEKDLMEQVTEINGVGVLVAEVDAPDQKTLGEWTEQYRDRLGSGIVVFGSIIKDKVAVTGVATKDLIKNKNLNIGLIIKVISEEFGGRGGGRPDFAQGGGTDTGRFKDFTNIALIKIEEALKQ